MPGPSWLHYGLGAVIVLMAVAAVLYVTTSEGQPSDLLPIGAEAPDMVGQDAQGADVRLSSQRGKWALVYFYPKDATPGCTKQACALRDAFSRYVEAGVTIFGVSRDGDASHDRFRAKYDLPFPLVADESGAVQRAYGVPSRLGMAMRVSFLVDPAGRVAEVWPDVDPGVHAQQVLQAVDKQALRR